MKSLVRGWAKDLGYAVCWLGSRFHRPNVRVLALYHSVGSREPLSMPMADFTRQMRFLKKRFRVVCARDLARAIVETPDRAIACVTFDDGLFDNFENALPILEELGLKASFFVPTGSLRRGQAPVSGTERHMSVDHLRLLAARGHEIGAHTVTHPDLTRLSRGEVEHEIRSSKETLEEILGASVTSFAYPKGRWNAVVREITAQAGFFCAVTGREGSIDERRVDWLTLPRVWINPTMGRLQFAAKVSPAVDLFEWTQGRRPVDVAS